MGGVGKRSGQGQPPQEQVAGRERERRYDGGEPPRAVEHCERRHAQDVGREAIARERDAVTPGQRADPDED